jgi:ABC-type transport system involved in multi-copper enzyme maturation permease subunit
MVGPVLYQEMLLGGRRGRQYVFRWVYAGWLVVQILYFYSNIGFWALVSGATTPVLAEVASRFVQVFVIQQLILLVLVTPAFAAGAITDEKTRGTLQYLLTTDLTSLHIVLGKLLGRTAQVAILAITGLPMLCFIGVFGGLEPVSLLAVLGVTVLPLLAFGAATMLASVWCKQTRDAVIGLYIIGGIAFFAVTWLGGPLDYLNPIYVLEPSWGHPDSVALKELVRRFLGSAVAWGLIAAVCTTLAVWRLRPAYLRQMQGDNRKHKARWWRARRAAIGDDPVRWMVRNVEGLAPLSVLRTVPRWLGLLTVFVLTVAACGSILLSALPSTAEGLLLLSRLQFAEFSRQVAIVGVGGKFFLMASAAMFLASFVVGIRCSGAVSGDREKVSWEALLLTPLPAKQLIRGKLWGIIGASYPYLAAYAVPALALAALGGTEPLVLTVLLLGVTWLAVYFIGATGIRCSVRATSSWRSLLATVAVGYVGGFIAFCILFPVTLMIAVLLWITLQVADRAMGTNFIGLTGGGNSFLSALLIASSLSLALMFWLLAMYFVRDAWRWVADRERVRFWDKELVEPVYRARSRRRPSKSRTYR